MFLLKIFTKIKCITNSFISRGISNSTTGDVGDILYNTEKLDDFFSKNYGTYINYINKDIKYDSNYDNVKKQIIVRKKEEEPLIRFSVCSNNRYMVLNKCSKNLRKIMMDLFTKDDLLSFYGFIWSTSA